MLHTNLVKIGLVVLERKMLTDDDGRQPTAIGHLSDSGDLKTVNIACNDSIFLSKIPLKNMKIQ